MYENIKSVYSTLKEEQLNELRRIVHVASDSGDTFFVAYSQLMHSGAARPFYRAIEAPKDITARELTEYVICEREMHV